MVLGRTQRDPLPVLAFGVMVLLSGGALVFTLLADLQNEVGFPDYGLGLIAFSFFAASLVVQVTLARLADSGEARKLLIAGVVLSVTALIWFGLADSMWSLVAARALGGAGAGCFEPAAKALVCVGRKDDAGRRLGFLTSAQTAGLVVGPVLGALIADLSGSLSLAFFVFAGLSAIMLPLIMLVPLVESDEPTSQAANPLELLRRPPVRRAVLITVALVAPVGMYEVVWSPLLQDFGASTTLIGISVALYGLPFLLAAPFGGRLGDRIGAERVSLWGGAIMVGVVVCMGFARSIPVLMVIGVMEAIVNASSIPNAAAAISRATSQSEQATGQGLAGGASMIAIAAMTLVSGWAYGAIGQTGVFLLAAGVSGSFLLLASLIPIDDDHDERASGQPRPGQLPSDSLMNES